MYYRICYNEVKAGHPESGYIIKIKLQNEDFTFYDEHDTTLPNLDSVKHFCGTMIWYYIVLGYKNFYDTMDKDADY